MTMDLWATVARVGDQITDTATQVGRQIVAGKLADMELEAGQKLTELELKHRNDPQGFSSEWDGYKKGVIKGSPAFFASHLDTKLSRDGQTVFRRLSVEHLNRQQSDANTSMKARLALASDQIAAHAMGGNVDAMAGALGEYDQILQSATGLGFVTPDEAQLMRHHTESRGRSELTLFSVAKAYEAGGPDFARAMVHQEIVSNPTLALSAEERIRLQNRSDTMIGDLERTRAQKTAEAARQDAETYARRNADLTIRASRGALGRVEVEDAYQNGAGWLQPHDYTRLTLALDKVTEEAARQQLALQRVDRAGQTVAAPAPSFADRTIGAEWSPAGRDKNPASSATGPGQFTDGTWLEVMRKHAPQLAAGKTDEQVLALRDSGTPQERRALHARMVDAYGNENAAFLKANGVDRVGDGEKYLAHFAGPAGALAILQADPNTPVRDVLSADVIKANGGMKRGGKAFADWTAGELHAWAAEKMGVKPLDPTPATIAVHVPYLDPRNKDDRDAVDLHFGAIKAGLDQRSAPPAERQAVTLTAVQKYGFLPSDVAGDIRGKLRNGLPADKIEAARFVSSIEATAPQAARDLGTDDYTVAHMLNDQINAGVPADIAVQRVDAAMRQDPAERVRREAMFGDKKITEGNRSWLKKQGRDWFGTNTAVPDALAGEFEDLVKDRFLATGDIDVARKVAWNDLSKVWAETKIGGKRFARYAPEAMYANGRDSSWIEGQLYHDLEQAGTAAPIANLKGRVQLHADRTSGHEDRPSYQVLEQDDNGVWGPVRGKDGKPLLGPDGKPMRWRPDWNSSPAADEERRGIAQTVDRARVLRDFRDLKSEVPANSTAGLFNPR
ncbi:hypothetical protein [Azospirillum rugosum]|uniref:Phage-Barnase-EndoU-ColicinE5/D-RelE-like nuclease domain-containing protein n=1 Tax=Azospirillum rugosum TaxID=416170 RepID=A0ABS4SQ76_9PROT|nr:hypothetical protein [Azospirillum rugosum]MBP2294714.1 hypothetical protein [Azospirillum rugosum]MDQ0527997.1 hypothetical protein [Azospirillum rugosum]